MATNVSVPLFETADRVTGIATAAVTGKRFLKISGNGTLPNPSVAPATAAVRAFGVAAFDAAVGESVSVLKKGVVPVTAGAAITADVEVEVGAAGVVIPKAAGVAVGKAVFDAANGAPAYIDLY
jgi:hypothetical protein